MRVEEIKTVACLGTGTMGHGVTFLAAKAGYSVRLYGRSKESIDKCLAGVDRAIALYEDNALMPKGSGAALKKRIIPTTDLKEAVKDADLITESVAENVEIKRQTYAVVEAACPSHTILTTNTSGLSLAALAEKLARPESFLSVHFFSPPYLMSLVEVTPIPATKPKARDLASRWVESLGNVPIPLEKDVQGFIANRIQAACLREALYIVEQGWASAETVDKAISLSLGRRYSETGPIESADMGGLDIFNSVLTQLCPVLDARTTANPLLAKAVKEGNMGMKTGKGIYNWPAETIAARRGAREQSLIAFMRQDQSKKS